MVPVLRAASIWMTDWATRRYGAALLATVYLQYFRAVRCAAMVWDDHLAAATQGALIVALQDLLEPLNLPHGSPELPEHTVARGTTAFVRITKQV